jgi:hypothetical protein
MKENYKSVIIISVIIILVMVIVAAVICIPNCDFAVTGVYRSHGMNIFGGRRW